MNRVARIARVRRDIRDWLPKTHSWSMSDWLNTYKSASEVGLRKSLEVEVENNSLWGVRLISLLQITYAKWKDENDILKNFDVVAVAVLKELGHDIYKLSSRADFYVVHMKKTKMLGHERVVPLQEAFARLDEHYKYQYIIRNLAGINPIQLGEEFKTIKMISQKIPGTVRELNIYDYKSNT